MVKENTARRSQSLSLPCPPGASQHQLFFNGLAWGISSSSLRDHLHLPHLCKLCQGINLHQHIFHIYRAFSLSVAEGHLWTFLMYQHMLMRRTDIKTCLNWLHFPLCPWEGLAWSLPACYICYLQSALPSFLIARPSLGHQFNMECDNHVSEAARWQSSTPRTNRPVLAFSNATESRQTWSHSRYHPWTHPPWTCYTKIGSDWWSQTIINTAIGRH